MIVRPFGSGDGCDCNPYTDLILRIEELERRAAAIVKSVQGIPPDGAGEVTLPVSDDVDGPSFGRRDVFAMSSEVRQTAEDAHAYTAAVADDVVELTAEIATLRDQVNALSPEGYDALIARIDTVSVIVDSLIETKVSKTGDTMTGNLALAMGNPVIYFKNTSVPDKAPPTETRYSGFLLRDNGSTDRGGVQACATATGGVMLITAKTSDASSTAYLRLYAKDDGTKYADAPSWSVGTNDNSDKILTIKMANSLPSLVHTTGNETVTGEKTFSVPIKIRRSGYFDWTNELNLLGSHGSSAQLFRFKDSAGNITCQLHHYIHSTNLNSHLTIGAYNKETDGTEVKALIGLVAKTNGEAIATAPTTPSTATSNEIATADWVLQKINEFATANNLQGLR